MIWFRPRTTDRDEGDAARPTVPLGHLEAVCDTDDEARAVLDSFGHPPGRVAHQPAEPPSDPPPPAPLARAV